MKVSVPSLQTPEVGGCEHLQGVGPDGLYEALLNCLGPVMQYKAKGKGPQSPTPELPWLKEAISIPFPFAAAQCQAGTH